MDWDFLTIPEKNDAPLATGHQVSTDSHANILDNPPFDGNKKPESGDPGPTRNEAVSLTIPVQNFSTTRKDSYSVEKQNAELLARRSKDSVDRDMLLPNRDREPKVPPIIAYPDPESSENNYLLCEPYLDYECEDTSDEYECSVNQPLTPEQQSDINLSSNKKPELAGSGYGKSMIEPTVHSIIADSNLDASDKISLHGISMSNGYIKLNRQAEELLLKDPDAYLLLSLIAIRARWRKSKFDRAKLQIGQAFIGDYLEIGLTRQRYRDAMQRIQQVYQIATFKGTNKGTIATLLNSDIFDINPQQEEPAKEPTKNQPGTNKEPLTKKGRKKEGKKEKQEKESGLPPAPALPPKIAFREKVELTQEQYDKAAAKFGKELVEIMLDELDTYKTSKGRDFANDYGLFKHNNWLVRKAKEVLQNQASSNPSSQASTPATNSYPQKITADLARKLEGKYFWEFKFGNIEITSKAGYYVTKFEATDIKGFEKWMKEMNL